MNVHVPAWKRLGLKLNGPDAGKGSGEAITNELPNKKRKLAGGDSSEPLDREQVAPMSKRNSNKGSADAESSSVKLNGTKRKAAPIPEDPAHNAKSSEAATSNSSLATERKTVKKRKSVSFTPDAKETDGPAEPDQVPGSEDAETTTQARAKKTKKKKANSSSPDRSSEIPVNSKSDSNESKPQSQSKLYLQYLQQFSSDKAHWKFNKNRQVQLLQNMFNLYRIPATYDPALVEYVGTLQGDAARSRLREQARKLLSEAFLPSDETNEGSFKDESNLASHEAKGSENALGEAKLVRAKAIMDVLGEAAPPIAAPPIEAPKQTEARSSPPVKPSTMQEQPKKRKRSRGKTRTNAVELSSNSSSSSDSGED